MIDDPTLPGDATVDLGSGSGGTSTMPAAPGDRFGRFRVDGVLGAGGMGVVFEANDPMLDRQVAIKVMGQRTNDTEGAALEARMVREAKAMARLSHENVVRVFEAGQTRAGVFLVMEMVAGTTLAKWLEEPRPWREVLGRFVAAGRGLVAAHRAGLVHRDFKPANVLLGRDGRVLVSDFGLVSVGAHAAQPTSDITPIDGLDLSNGAIVGTPRYMAPEQHEGRTVDARTDQWAFCTSLWEGLYGEHPYPAETLAVLAMRVCLDDPRPPRDHRGVPPRIHAALLRGMARDPAARYPSMEALLAALEHDPARRRRGLALAAGVVALSSVAAVGWLRRAPDAPHAGGPCDRPPALLWSPAERVEIAQRWRKLRGAAGDDAFSRTATRLDGLEAAMRDVRATVCRDRDRSSAEFLERVGCLQRLHADRRALVEVFVDRDSAAVVDGAVAAAAGLPSSETCLDPRTRGRGVDTLAPDERVVAAGLRTTLQAAEALYRAGLMTESLAAAREAVATAKQRGVPRFEAEARLALSRILTRQDANAEAEAELRRAAQLAASAGDDSTVAAAWVALVWVVSRAQRADEILTMAPLVEAAIQRAGNPPRLRADYAFHHASGLVELGRYREAVTLLEGSLAIWREELEDDPIAIARVVNTLANTYSYMGEDALALARYQDVLTLREAVFGARHPDVAYALVNFGRAEVDAGDPASGLARCQRALEILEGIRGLPPSRFETVYKCLGNAYAAAGDLDAANAALQHAIEIGSAPPGSGFLPYTLIELAEVDCERGRAAEALAGIDRALRLMASNPTDRNEFLVTRSRALNDLGRHAEARRQLELAGPELGTGRRLRAEFDFQRARAMWPTRADRAAARTLAESAGQRFTELRLRRAHARVEAWLATRR